MTGAVAALWAAPDSRFRGNDGIELDSTDVCVGEVLAFVEEGIPGHFCKGVGEAIAEV